MKAKMEKFNKGLHKSNSFWSYYNTEPESYGREEVVEGFIKEALPTEPNWSDYDRLRAMFAYFPVLAQEEISFQMKEVLNLEEVEENLVAWWYREFAVEIVERLERILREDFE